MVGTMVPGPSDGPTFPVYDVFFGIQGEATWAGRAMLFVRFSGCPLSCTWCDEPQHRDTQATRLLTATQILETLRQIEPTLTHLLLTGGEPLAVPHLDVLVSFLKDHGYWIALETSGVGGPMPPGIDWVTLSPKTALSEHRFSEANEIKYIVNATPSPHQTDTIQRRATTHGNVWVQPQSTDHVMDRRALHHCLAHIRDAAGRIRLSLQTHKLIGLP